MEHTLVRPPKAAPGDRIAVVSPSFAAPGFAPEVHEQAMRRLRELTGLEPVEYPTTRELGASPEKTMEPFAASFDEWHRRTPPADWYEGLMKAYAGSAIANDFYAEIARYVDLETRALVERAVGADEQDAFVKQVLAEAIAQDPRLGSRLALWGRRLVGEALSQAQRVAASHDALTALLVDDGSGVGADLAELTRMFERLTTNHSERMQALGLTA